MSQIREKQESDSKTIFLILGPDICFNLPMTQKMNEMTCFFAGKNNHPDPTQTLLGVILYLRVRRRGNVERRHGAGREFARGRFLAAADGLVRVRVDGE